MNIIKNGIYIFALLACLTISGLVIGLLIEVTKPISYYVVGAIVLFFVGLILWSKNRRKYHE